MCSVAVLLKQTGCAQRGPQQQQSFKWCTVASFIPQIQSKWKKRQNTEISLFFRKSFFDFCHFCLSLKAPVVWKTFPYYLSILHKSTKVYSFHQDKNEQFKGLWTQLKTKVHDLLFFLMTAGISANSYQRGSSGIHQNTGRIGTASQWWVRLSL